MNVLGVIVGMLLVGLVIGAAASWIWRGPRPYGLAGDLAIGAIVAVVIGLVDWYVIPAMGFSDTLRNIGLAIEPAIGVILVLWLVRRARN